MRHVFGNVGWGLGVAAILIGAGLAAQTGQAKVHEIPERCVKFVVPAEKARDQVKGCEELAKSGKKLTDAKMKECKTAAEDKLKTYKALFDCKGGKS